MSAAADTDSNAGYIALGSPSSGGAEFPPSGAQGRVVVHWKGGVKIQKAKGAGKDGANQTIQGTQVAEAVVVGSYPDRDPHADLWEAALAVISPYGPGGTKSWDLAQRFAKLYGATAAIVEDLEGPNPKEGTDEMTIKIKLSIWTKPTKSGTGTGTTPTTPQPYTPVALPPLFQRPPVTSAPKVNP
ncbi:MAG TPA: hypothetical protein VIM73_11650 [Polyangiaceae bacterium]